MRCLDFLCAFLDFFERQRIIQTPPSWRRGLFYFVEIVRRRRGWQCYPWKFAAAQSCTGGYRIRPYGVPVNGEAICA